MKKKLIYLLLLFFIGISVVSAATHYYNSPFSSFNYGNDKISVVDGLDKKGNIEAYVGTSAENGLFVYKDGKLLFTKEAIDGLFSNVTLLDDYVVVYGTTSINYEFNANDVITSFFVFDMDGNLIGDIDSLKNSCTGMYFCDSLNSGIYGIIINAGNNTFAFAGYPDAGYFPNAYEGESKRRMYELVKVTPTGIELVADDTITSYDQLLINNANEIPYVLGVKIEGDYKAIIGDNRLFTSTSTSHFKLYKNDEVVFDVNIAEDISDYIAIANFEKLNVQDIAILDDYVIVLLNTNDGVSSIVEYNKDGKFITVNSLTGKALRVVGNGRTYMYNANKSLFAKKHYIINTNVIGNGEVINYLSAYSWSNEKENPAYVYAGGEVVVGVKPAKSNELKEVTVDGVKLECVVDDDMIRCPFTMPEKDVDLEVKLGRIEYKILNGDSPVYNGKGNVVIRTEADASLFDRLVINGKELVKDVDYTVREGSTIVEIFESFLQKLDEGEYTVDIEYVDGYVSSTLLTINLSEEEPVNNEVDDKSLNPKTVDVVGLASILLVVSIILIAFAKKNIKVKKYTN